MGMGMFLFFFFFKCLIFKWIVGLEIERSYSLWAVNFAAYKQQKSVFHKYEDEKSKPKTQSALVSVAAPFLLCDASCSVFSPWNQDISFLKVFSQAPGLRALDGTVVPEPHF